MMVKIHLGVILSVAAMLSKTRDTHLMQNVFKWSASQCSVRFIWHARGLAAPAECGFVEMAAERERAVFVCVRILKGFEYMMV